MKRFTAILFTVILLAGCGGGEVPKVELGDYASIKAAYRKPNYPHASRSHVYVWGDTVYVGGDVEPRETLRRADTENGITYFIGASRDGVGVDRLKNYVHDLKTRDNTVRFSNDGFLPFRVRPKIWLGLDFLERLNRDEVAASEAFYILVESMRVLNDALPPEFQIILANPENGDRPLDEGSIYVHLIPSTSIESACGGPGALACARPLSRSVRNTRRSEIRFPDNLGELTFSEAHELVIHELLHAIGVWGHVDSVEFPDSILGKSGDFFPNPGFTIHRVDREILQIMYMSQRTQNYNDWGEWSDTTLHLVGRSDDGFVQFRGLLYSMGCRSHGRVVQGPEEALWTIHPILVVRSDGRVLCWGFLEVPLLQEAPN